jgi:hypothetical protein
MEPKIIDIDTRRGPFRAGRMTFLIVSANDDLEALDDEYVGRLAICAGAVILGVVGLIAWAFLG